MKRSVLLKRYRYLWTGEVAAAAVFALLVLRGAAPGRAWPDWVCRWYAVAVLDFILLQGAVWWKWKLGLLLAGRSVIPHRVLSVFRLFKTLNWVLIGFFPIIVLCKWTATGEARIAGDEVFGLLILAGASLEQVNYYYYQLMYDCRVDRYYLARYRRLRVGNIGRAISSERKRGSK